MASSFVSLGFLPPQVVPTFFFLIDYFIILLSFIVYQFLLNFSMFFLVFYLSLQARTANLQQVRRLWTENLINKSQAKSHEIFWSWSTAMASGMFLLIIPSYIFKLKPLVYKWNCWFCLIFAGLDCKLLKDCCSSRCKIEVFRHLELCRKHVVHDLSVTFKGNSFVLAKTLPI